MKVLIFIIFYLCLSYTSKSQVHLTKDIDPDIVIINIEEGDRAFIGNLIQKIDSCNPALIGIDAWFVSEKDNYQDSILQKALSETNKEVLAYTRRDTVLIRSHEKFEKLSNEKGIAYLIAENEIAIKFIPLTNINGKTHIHFALQIAKKWKPNLEYQYKVDEQVSINYERTVEQYLTFNGSDINYKKHSKFLKNKIVLLGYLGPSNEDKHITPLGSTYGIIIIANQVRMILNK